MEFRHLGRSGMLVSEISYGNWITHGSQVEEDAALACVRAALDEGITTFDTADVYAGTRAEAVLGRALAGERREGLEIFTKVYWPTGEGRNDRGLSRKHIMESINGSLTRLQTDYVDLYQCHRYDYATPLEETMQALADVVHAGKAHYIGVSEWTAAEIRAAHELATDLKIQLVSNQPQYSMLWRVIEAEVVPTSRGAGHRPDRLVARWRRACCPASTCPASRRRRARAPPTTSRARTSSRAGCATTCSPRCRSCDRSPRAPGSRWPQLAVAWVLQNPNVSSAIVGATRPEQVRDNVKAAGVKLDADTLKAIDEIVEPITERDAAKTASPTSRP